MRLRVVVVVGGGVGGGSFARFLAVCCWGWWGWWLWMSCWAKNDAARCGCCYKNVVVDTLVNACSLLLLPTFFHFLFWSWLHLICCSCCLCRKTNNVSPHKFQLSITWIMLFGVKFFNFFINAVFSFFPCILAKNFLKVVFKYRSIKAPKALKHVINSCWVANN